MTTADSREFTTFQLNAGKLVSKWHVRIGKFPKSRFIVFFLYEEGLASFDGSNWKCGLNSERPGAQQPANCFTGEPGRLPV